MSSSTETTVTLTDAKVDVTLRVKFGDLRAIEAAGNAHMKFAPGKDGQMESQGFDGTWITSRDEVLLSRIPKTWAPTGGNVPATPVTPDWIDGLSPSDGKALEGACWKLVNAVQHAYAEGSPKE